MTDIEKLLAIEAIKQLKAKYFLGVDTKDFDLLRREVFAEDARFDLPEYREEPFLGAEAIIGFFTAAGLLEKVTVHHGHMPIIEITSDTTATGLWAFEDRIYRRAEPTPPGDFQYLHGFGHYHETYVRLDKGWRIQTERITRLRVETKNVI